MYSDTEDEEDAEMSLKDQLLSLAARVIGLKKTPIEVEESRERSVSKCLHVVKALSLSHFVHFGRYIYVHMGSCMLFWFRINTI